MVVVEGVYKRPSIQTQRAKDISKKNHLVPIVTNRILVYNKIYGCFHPLIWGHIKQFNIHLVVANASNDYAG